MKVNAIKFNYSAPIFSANNKSENNTCEKNSKNVNKIAYGIAGLAAAGIAAYAIMRGRNSSPKPTAIAQEIIPGLNDIKASLITNSEIKPFSRRGIGETKPFEGIEKLIYTDNKDGTGRTYQHFYHKNKLYECNIYEEITGETPSTKTVTRYNLAYENGKLAGIAKQDIYKDGLQHGEYKDGGFNPFPIMIKMKGDKEFKEANIYTADALFDADKRFDPYNL